MNASVEITVPEPTRGGRIINTIIDVFLRLLAIAFFILAIQIWANSVGYYEGPEHRFDTMNAHARIYTAIMVVLLPVASVGLWTTLSWGRVVWFFAIFVQTLTIFQYRDTVEVSLWLILFHLLTLVIYLGLQLLASFITKEE